MADSEGTAPQTGGDGARRDFLMLTTGAFSVVGVAYAAWPFIQQWNPAADTLAASTTEVDLGPIEEGQSITVIWQGKPVFIRRRTAAEIKAARDDDSAKLPDPETDAERVQKPQWLVVVGICTHLGCIPKGQRTGEQRGKYNGWFCPCHGSHYDTSGRIRSGPAPENLLVPAYKYLSDTKILIG